MAAAIAAANRGWSPRVPPSSWRAPRSAGASAVPISRSHRRYVGPPPAASDNAPIRVGSGPYRRSAGSRFLTVLPPTASYPVRMETDPRRAAETRMASARLRARNAKIGLTAAGIAFFAAGMSLAHGNVAGHSRRQARPLRPRGASRRSSGVTRWTPASWRPRRRRRAQARRSRDGGEGLLGHGVRGRRRGSGRSWRGGDPAPLHRSRPGLQPVSTRQRAQRGQRGPRAVPVSRAFADMLELSLAIAAETDGLVDPTLGGPLRGRRLRPRLRARDDDPPGGPAEPAARMGSGSSSRGGCSRAGRLRARPERRRQVARRGRGASRCSPATGFVSAGGDLAVPRRPDVGAAGRRRGHGSSRAASRPAARATRRWRRRWRLQHHLIDPATGRPRDRRGRR